MLNAVQIVEEPKCDRSLVTERNLYKLEGQIEKLNRRASRLKLPALKLMVDRTNPVITYLTDLGKYGPVRLSYYVTLEGSTPRVDGYTLIAKLEGTEHGNLIKTLIKTDLPEEYRNRVTCDHCQTNRFRKDTFVLRDQTGALKQVGRNCLADYMRSAEYASWLVELAELRLNVSQMDDDCESAEELPRGVRIEDRFDLVGVMELTAGSVRARGWVSAKKAREMATDFNPVESTAESVRFHLSKTRDQAGRLIGQIPVTQEDQELAAGALQWIKDKTDSNNTLSDYFHNCKILIASESITNSQIGIAASIVAMYSKAVETKRQESLSFGDANAYIGNEKERITVNATLTKAFNFETQGYGYRASSVLMAVYVFRTAEGHTLTWKTEDKKLIVDAEYKVTGTIKAHENYKGTLQTVLTRCKLQSADRRFAPVLGFSPAKTGTGYTDRDAVHHVDDALTGAAGKIDRTRWIKMFNDLVSKHGKPSIKLDDCIFHVVFDWRQ